MAEMFILPWPNFPSLIIILIRVDCASCFTLTRRLNVASPVLNSRSPFRIIHVYLYTLVLKIDVMVLKSFLHKTPEDWCNAKLSQWHLMSLNKIAKHTTYNFVISMKITHINIYSKITILRKLNMTKVMPFCITKQHSACPCDWVSNWKGIDFQ